MQKLIARQCFSAANPSISSSVFWGGDSIASAACHHASHRCKRHTPQTSLLAYCKLSGVSDHRFQPCLHRCPPKTSTALDFQNFPFDLGQLSSAMHLSPQNYSPRSGEYPRFCLIYGPEFSEGAIGGWLSAFLQFLPYGTSGLYQNRLFLRYLTVSVRYPPAIRIRDLWTHRRPRTRSRPPPRYWMLL